MGIRISKFARVERQLDEDGLLIVLEDGSAGFARSADPISILNILLSDATSEAKVRSLMEEEVPWISSADWTRVVEDFEPTPELTERVHTIIDDYESMVAGIQGSGEQSKCLVDSIYCSPSPLSKQEGSWS